MKVLIASDTNSPRLDGISRFLLNLEPFLKPFDVRIVAPDFGIPKNSLSVERFGLLRLRFGDFYFCLPKISRIRRLVQKCDVVFSQSIGPVGGLSILYAKRFGKPVVLYAHLIDWEVAGDAVNRFGGFASFVVRRVGLWLYNKCSCIIVASSRNADLLASVGVTVPKVVIPLGVDTGRFRPGNKLVAKKVLGLSGRKVVGFVGRLAREKDLPTLYAAFKLLQKKIPEVVLLVVGTGLQGLIPEDSSVFLAGPVEDIVPFLQAMDVFVLPSLTETNSLATMEAMACALPVVVTPVGSVADYVVDGKNGFFFSRGDVVFLASKLFELLSNPKLCARLGRFARQTVIEKRRFGFTGREIVKLLRDVAK